MANSDVVTLILAHVSQMLLFLIPIIAVCAVLKIVFDVLYDFLFGITGRSSR